MRTRTKPQTDTPSLPVLLDRDRDHYEMETGETITHNRLVMEGRIATTADQAGIHAGWLGLSRVKTAGEGAGVGDIIVPRTGRLAGVPLRVLGFGGRKMTMAMIPGYGLGPAGRINFLVCETFYRNGMNTGIRINLPIDER
jgi:hypothetical protein